MDDAVGDFCAITGATPQVARHFLNIADGDPSQAIQLFFDSPDLAAAATEVSQQPPPAPAASSRPSARSASAGREDEHGVVHLDSDSDDIAMDETDDGILETTHTPPVPASTTAPQSSAFEDDEAMARRLQEEMYAGGDMSGDYDLDGVRAPLARTTETLVGPGADWGPDDMQSNVLQQMRQRGMARTSKLKIEGTKSLSFR
jgi:UBX domain-containing protein 7